MFRKFWTLNCTLARKDQTEHDLHSFHHVYILSCCSFNTIDEIFSTNSCMERMTQILVCLLSQHLVSFFQQLICWFVLYLYCLLYKRNCNTQILGKIPPLLRQKIFWTFLPSILVAIYDFFSVMKQGWNHLRGAFTCILFVFAFVFQFIFSFVFSIVFSCASAFAAHMLCKVRPLIGGPLRTRPWLS